MFYDNILKKVYSLKKQTEEIKIIFAYRYISLVVTSLFYLINNAEHPFGKRIFIIACISISSILINYLYMRNNDSKAKTGILVLIETIGNCFILIPSGGLSSPYVWYSLNTILITSVDLDRKYCWLNLFIYLTASTWITHLMFDNEDTLLSLVTEQSNLILSFLLITAVIQLLVKYIKKIQCDRVKLEKVNHQLVSANSKVRSSINYIMELYQAMHLLATQNDKHKLINLITQYTKKITGTDTAFFFSLEKPSDKVDEILTVEPREIDRELQEEIKNKIPEQWNNIIDSNEYLKMNLKGKTFILVPIKSNHMTHGILAIEKIRNQDKMSNRETLEQLRFLSILGAIVIEKSQLERVNHKLLIAEEQNRIANEIHDSVLQKLFSISCGIFTMMKVIDKKTSEDIVEELNVMREGLNSTMKELRTTIYGLSWKKGGDTGFMAEITNYINQIKKLNNININFDTLGSMEDLSITHRRVLYRIICEAVGNALRHGKASSIEISLDIQNNIAFLNIKDDGQGFDYDKVKESKQGGLGVQNIHQLVHSLEGEITLESQIGRGTTIRISIPRNGIYLRKGEVV